MKRKCELRPGSRRKSRRGPGCGPLPNAFVYQYCSCGLSGLRMLHEILTSPIDRKDLTKPNERGNTLLNFICAEGDIEALKWLLKNGCHDDESRIKLINSINLYGWTPMFYACIKGHYEVVKFLVEKGADITYCNDKCDGASIILAAASHGCVNILAEFYRRENLYLYLQLSSEGSSILLNACIYGNINVVKWILKNMSSDSIEFFINSSRNDGMTVLKAVFIYERYEIAKLIILWYTKESINTNELRTNPFATLCKNEKYLSCIRWLVSKGGDIERTIEGQSPLGIALHKNQRRIIEWILFFSRNPLILNPLYIKGVYIRLSLSQKEIFKQILINHIKDCRNFMWWVRELRRSSGRNPMLLLAGHIDTIGLHICMYCGSRLSIKYYINLKNIMKGIFIWNRIEYL